MRRWLRSVRPLDSHPSLAYVGEESRVERHVSPLCVVAEEERIAVDEGGVETLAHQVSLEEERDTHTDNSQRVSQTKPTEN